MPSADRYLAGLGRGRVKSLDDALLICDVELYSRNGSPPGLYRYKMGRPNPDRPRCGLDWDIFAPPDALLRFRFRDEYPISLFGPEDHWGFFVSIPRVSLAIGDSLAVKIWDRDSGTAETGNMNPKRDEFMGETTLRFDGTLPLVMKSLFFLLRCNAIANPRQPAQSWLGAAEQMLKQAAAWRPRAGEYNFGSNRALEQLTDNFGRGNLRYPAGFLGWDHPEIAGRLARVRQIGEADDQKLRELVTELRARSPLVKPGVDLGGVRLVGWGCESGDCHLEVEGSADFCRKNAVAGVGDDGTFLVPGVTHLDGSDCKADQGRGKFRARLRSPILLWVGGKGKARIYQLGL